MSRSATLAIDCTDDEIARALEPYVRSRCRPEDPQWSAELDELRRAQRRARRRHAFTRWLPAFRRTQRAVDFNYNRQWAATSYDRQLSTDGPDIAAVWKGQPLRMRAIGAKRVHLLLLSRVIERLRPARVLEVGSGNGVNLFALACRHPSVSFTGIELTAGGTDMSAAIRRQRQAPDALQRFAPEPLIDPGAVSRVAIVRASAAMLPFPDASFDLVFTVQALEQMEPIRHAALRELRRVARRDVAMIEPFHDWNRSGISGDFVRANDYFRGRVQDLDGYGLHPVWQKDDLPAKVTLHVGLVLCETT